MRGSQTTSDEETSDTDMDPDEDEKREALARQREEFLEFCKENELDPDDDDSMEMHKEVLAESGDAWWDGLDDDNRDGWTDNMNKDD